MSTHNLNIKQDMQNQMFFVMVNGGAAYLKYDHPSQEILDIKEIYIPNSSRNKRVAEELIVHTMNYAHSKNFRVIPSCSFTKAFFKKNPGHVKVME